MLYFIKSNLFFILITIFFYVFCVYQMIILIFRSHFKSTAKMILNSVSIGCDEWLGILRYFGHRRAVIACLNNSGSICSAH